mmetsp:Transcript_19033/g.42075  ORF Transcript_19033/g.42075 Transcript_19033/m.42075 type:complete len:243 (-) Transcript_19033:697-1425(-)
MAPTRRLFVRSLSRSKIASRPVCASSAKSAAASGSGLRIAKMRRRLSQSLPIRVTTSMRWACTRSCASTAVITGRRPRFPSAIVPPTSRVAAQIAQIRECKLYRAGASRAWLGCPSQDAACKTAHCRWHRDKDRTAADLFWPPPRANPGIARRDCCSAAELVRSRVATKEPTAVRRLEADKDTHRSRLSAKRLQASDNSSMHCVFAESATWASAPASLKLVTLRPRVFKKSWLSARKRASFC